jgi:hypothetical protein
MFLEELMRKLLKFLYQLANLLLVIFLTACGAAATAAPAPTVEAQAAINQQQTQEAALTLSAPTSAAPASQDSFQTTSDQLPAQPRLGQMQLSYPVLMPPGASKTVDFSIYIPPELASASPESFKREVLPPDSPRPLGKYTEYNALILVSQHMRVELLAPNFSINELYPAEQELDMVTPDTRTNWGWAITAPAMPNEYVLVIKVYIVGESVPRWVGSFDVLVEAATPTPAPEPTFTPTPTPISAADLILKNISDNAVTLIGTLLTTIVAIIGLYLQFRKPKETKK